MNEENPQALKYKESMVSRGREIGKWAKQIKAIKMYELPVIIKSWRQKVQYREYSQ